MTTTVQSKPIQLSTASALLAHIALKTQSLELFGGVINVRQWTASERIKYLALIALGKDEDDTLTLLRHQASVVALSLVDEKSKPLFPVIEWVEGMPIFEDGDAVESFVQNRAQEVSEAFVKVAGFNGVVFSSKATQSDDDEEEQALKN